MSPLLKSDVRFSRKHIYIYIYNIYTYIYIYVNELVTTRLHTRKRFYYLVRITYARTSVQTINKSEEKNATVYKNRIFIRN